MCTHKNFSVHTALTALHNDLVRCADKCVSMYASGSTSPRVQHVREAERLIEQARRHIADYINGTSYPTGGE
jgi:hypothetical protein